MAATSQALQAAVDSSTCESVDLLENLYRMSVDQSERIGELLDDSRVELVDGLLVAKMVKNPPRDVACTLSQGDLEAGRSRGLASSNGSPIRIPTHNEPEPDVQLGARSAARLQGTAHHSGGRRSSR